MNTKHKGKNRRKSSDITVILSSVCNGTDGQVFAPVNHSPLPSRDEIDRRFSQIMVSIDLKDEKRQILEDYSDEKKWQLVCDTNLVSAKEKPDYYINAIKNHMTEVNNKTKSNKLQQPWEQILSDLEISLRTNCIKWVREFLNDHNNGLNVIVDLLTKALNAFKQDSQSTLSSNNHTISKNVSSMFNKSFQEKSKMHTTKSYSSDVHSCVKCLRAIMNHKHGFSLVFDHDKAIDCIVSSLLLNNTRTRTLVLDLISVFCLVKGGHQKILKSFENFKKTFAEDKRFQTLVKWFTSDENFALEFSIACIRCINLLVHTPVDMNYRVYLQHEFKLLGLDSHLQTLRNMGCEELTNQINAYFSNSFDVAALMSDAQHVNEMKDKSEELKQLNKKLEEVENSALDKIAALETHLSNLKEEKKSLQAKLGELASELKSPTPTNDDQQLPAALIPAPPPLPLPPPPPPPPPPPLPTSSNSSIPSCGSKAEQKSDSIKSVVKSRQRLAALNWNPLNHSQIKGTIYEDINEDSIYKILNLEELEEMFKLRNKNNSCLAASLLDIDIGTATIGRAGRASVHSTLLHPTRQRNVAIARKKLNLVPKELVEAIENFDLKKLPSEKIYLLERLLPSEEEEQAFVSFQSNAKLCETLTDDDQLIIALLNLKRGKQKIQVMSLIHNFESTMQPLLPQVHAIRAASTSLRKSIVFKKLIQIILFIGNYMNSQNRGGAFGFKLQNLELLHDTKSNDKKQTLLHFIVKICQEKFPDVLNFYKDFDFMERAAGASVEIIMSDLSELKKQISAADNELEINGSNKLRPLLQKFLRDAKDKLTTFEKDHACAMESFADVATYFGENSKTATPSVFFGIILKFINYFKQAKQEVASRKQSEIIKKQQNSNPVVAQSEIWDELKHKVKEKKVLNQEEVGFGTVDGLLEDLKNEPFVRHDAYYKSRRKNEKA